MHPNRNRCYFCITSGKSNMLVRTDALVHWEPRFNMLSRAKIFATWCNVLMHALILRAFASIWFLGWYLLSTAVRHRIICFISCRQLTSQNQYWCGRPCWVWYCSDFISKGLGWIGQRPETKSGPALCDLVPNPASFLFWRPIIDWAISMGKQTIVNKLRNILL